MSGSGLAVWIIFWMVLVVGLLGALVVLVATHWGRSKPLRICIVLSLLAHVLLAGYAATVQIVSAGKGSLNEEILQFVLFDPEEGPTSEPQQQEPLEPSTYLTLSAQTPFQKPLVGPATLKDRLISSSAITIIDVITRVCKTSRPPMSASGMSKPAC